MSQSLILTRRVFLTNLIAWDTKQKPKSPLIKPINANIQNLDSDVLYVYETNRFKKMITILDDHNSCYTVRQRVDWYDMFSGEVRTMNESTMYFTDVAGQS